MVYLSIWVVRLYYFSAGSNTSKVAQNVLHCLQPSESTSIFFFYYIHNYYKIENIKLDYFFLNMFVTMNAQQSLNILMNDAEAATNIESEKPVIISLEEIEQATNNFDEARKIGQGGYGSVYFGIIRERVCN